MNFDRFDKRFGIDDDWDCQLYKYMPQGLVKANDDVKSFISQHYLLKTEVKKQIEGMKKEIRYEEIDTGIGIDKVEYDGQEKEHSYNKALSDLLTLLKIGD